MSCVYIGLSSPKDWKIGAEAIKWWTGKEYSHAYVRFEHLDERSTVYQASHGMVHFTSKDRFLGDNKSIKEFKVDLSSEQRKAFMDLCWDLCGESYSTCELAQIFAVDLLHKVGIKLTVEDQKGYICSELVGALCIDTLGMKFSKPRYLLKPQDIDEAFSSLNKPSLQEAPKA